MDVPSSPSPVHAHSHGHGHAHAHGHGHAAESPHPEQPLRWSLLRIGLAGRIGFALAASALLWAVVAVAMR